MSCTNVDVIIGDQWGSSDPHHRHDFDTPHLHSFLKLNLDYQCLYVMMQQE